VQRQVQLLPSCWRQCRDARLAVTDWDSAARRAPKLTSTCGERMTSAEMGLEPERMLDAAVVGLEADEGCGEAVEARGL